MAEVYREVEDNLLDKFVDVACRTVDYKRAFQSLNLVFASGKPEQVGNRWVLQSVFPMMKGYNTMAARPLSVAPLAARLDNKLQFQNSRKAGRSSSTAIFSLKMSKSDPKSNEISIIPPRWMVFARRSPNFHFLKLRHWNKTYS